MTRPALRIVDEPPNWGLRSTLTITPGLWKMRSGHTAKVEKRIDIPYTEGRSGKPAVYPIWKGICVDCNDPMTWTINGCFAAVGRHPNDITGPA